MVSLGDPHCIPIVKLLSFAHVISLEHLWMFPTNGILGMLAPDHSGWGITESQALQAFGRKILMALDRINFREAEKVMRS
jgi:hypothetical protein